MQENGSKPSSLHRVFFFLAAVHKRLFYRCAAGAAGLRSLGIGEGFLNKQDGFVIQRHCLQICKNRHEDTFTVENSVSRSILLQQP